MRAPQRLVEVWAANADGRGQCGSGWVVGQSGVLCCRHVLDRYLAGVAENHDRPAGLGVQPVLQIRQATASSATDWIGCIIAWQHPVRDLVLLQIIPGAEQSWNPPMEQPTRLAATGQRPSVCVAIGFLDAEVKPTRLRGSDQAAGRLLPAGGARDPQGLVPFDVDTSVPSDAALWAGFSGSVVHDEHDRLVALVAKVHPDRRQRRLLVVPVEDAATDPAFASEAAAVGLDPTVEDHQAPLWRHSVDPRALTAAGVPARVADVGDLRAVGVHSSPVDGQGRYPATWRGTGTVTWTRRWRMPERAVAASCWWSVTRLRARPAAPARPSAEIRCCAGGAWRCRWPTVACPDWSMPTWVAGHGVMAG